ncbi:hypothetical protein EDB19DRAFT_1831291 [Suillus lakei]|nr:hypothetical protein EDB19DRAFT_1831291 [Suillus lakei]
MASQNSKSFHKSHPCGYQIRMLHTNVVHLLGYPILTVIDGELVPARCVSGHRSQYDSHMSSFIPCHCDDYPPPLGEEPSHLEQHLQGTGEIHLSGVQQVVITACIDNFPQAIHTTDLTLGLRHISTGFHLTVNADDAECQTTNKPVDIDQAVFDWNERILLDFLVKTMPQSFAPLLLCQANGTYLDLDILVALFQDALDLRPTSDPGQTHHPVLVIALLSHFANMGFQMDADKAEESLNDVLDSVASEPNVTAPGQDEVQDCTIGFSGGWAIQLWVVLVCRFMCQM